MVKLYLDDVRMPSQSGYKDSDWFIVRNYADFVSAIEKHFSNLEVASFDHDIDSYDDNGNELTGYSCVKWLCGYIEDNNLDITNLEIRFHTANVVGKVNMEVYWQNFYKYYRSINK